VAQQKFYAEKDEHIDVEVIKTRIYFNFVYT
jgi:hypothetical protein